MASTPELGSLELPATEPYRVVGVGANYLTPTEALGGDGKPTVTYVNRLGGHGEIVHLVGAEARRLTDLGAVKPAGEPKSYDELDDPELAILATQRGVTVRSSGADPDRPLRADYINALHTHDLGSDTALVAASSTPGGIILSGDEGVSPVLVDGVHTSPATEQTGDSLARGEGFDARGKSATEVSDWITRHKPNGSETVAAAYNDPEAAATVLEAEQASSQGDPRKTVVDKLKAISDRSE